MLRNVLVVLALAFLTAPVFGQQAPGVHLPPPPKVHTGHSEEGGESALTADREILRLRSLVKAQQEKLSLLEAKIKLLEKELQNQRGVSK